MIDVREAILDRLETLLATVPGVANSYRDRGDVDSFELPAVFLLDGSEELENVEDVVRNKSVYMPAVIMRLRPIITLITKPRDGASNDTVNGVAAPIGPELSLWRVLIKSAIENDEQLIDLLSPMGQMVFHGCDTDMIQDDKRRGFLLMHYSFRYPLLVNVAETPQPRPTDIDNPFSP